MRDLHELILLVDGAIPADYAIANIRGEASFGTKCPFCGEAIPAWPTRDGRTGEYFLSHLDKALAVRQHINPLSVSNGVPNPNPCQEWNKRALVECHRDQTTLMAAADKDGDLWFYTSDTDGDNLDSIGVVSLDEWLTDLIDDTNAYLEQLVEGRASLATWWDDDAELETNKETRMTTKAELQKQIEELRAQIKELRESWCDEDYEGWHQDGEDEDEGEEPEVVLIPVPADPTTWESEKQLTMLLFGPDATVTKRETDANKCFMGNYTGTEWVYLAVYPNHHALVARQQESRDAEGNPTLAWHAYHANTDGTEKYHPRYTFYDAFYHVAEIREAALRLAQHEDERPKSIYIVGGRRAARLGFPVPVGGMVVCAQSEEEAIGFAEGRFATSMVDLTARAVGSPPWSTPVGIIEEWEFD